MSGEDAGIGELPRSMRDRHADGRTYEQVWMKTVDFCTGMMRLRLEEALRWAGTEAVNEHFAHAAEHERVQMNGMCWMAIEGLDEVHNGIRKLLNESESIEYRNRLFGELAERRAKDGGDGQ